MTGRGQFPTIQEHCTHIRIKYVVRAIMNLSHLCKGPFFAITPKPSPNINSCVGLGKEGFPSEKRCSDRMELQLQQPCVIAFFHLPHQAPQDDGFFFAFPVMQGWSLVRFTPATVASSSAHLICQCYQDPRLLQSISITDWIPGAIILYNIYMVLIHFHET